MKQICISLVFLLLLPGVGSAATVISGTVGDPTLTVNTFDNNGETTVAVLTATGGAFTNPLDGITNYYSSSSELEVPADPIGIGIEFYWFLPDGKSYRAGEPKSEWDYFTPTQQEDIQADMNDIAGWDGQSYAFPYDQEAAFPPELFEGAPAAIYDASDIFSLGWSGVAAGVTGFITGGLVYAIALGLAVWFIRRMYITFKLYTMDPDDEKSQWPTGELR